MEPTRVNLGKAPPKLYQGVMQLETLVTAASKAAGIADGFAHLLRLRASQMNECAYCVRMHTRDAIAAGESPDRIALIAAWRESQYFTAKERAALELVEAVTFVAEGQIRDEVYASAAATLTPEEIAAVEWIGVVINAWNRIAIASRYPVAP